MGLNDTDAWKPTANKKRRENPVINRQYIQDRKTRKKSKLAPSRWYYESHKKMQLIPPVQNPHTPATIPQTLSSPASEHRDPTYLPSDTPRSRREMQPTRIELPMTTSRTKAVTQD